MHRAIDNSFLIPFITEFADLQLAQVWCHTARNGLQPMTSGAVLVVGRGADFRRQIMLRMIAIGVGLEPFVTQLFQVLSIHRLGRDIAVGQRLACRQQ